MTRDEIRAALVRCDAATPGPWEKNIGIYYDPDGCNDCWFGRGPTVIPQSKDQGTADAELIAHARTDLPRALAALERVLALADELAFYAMPASGADCIRRLLGGEDSKGIDTVAAIRKAVEGA